MLLRCQISLIFIPRLLARDTESDLPIPIATVSKIISEILQPGESFTREARDVLIDCCVEFVSMLSSEANDIMEKESKKTMGVEHIAEALKGLGFPEYVKEVVAAVDEHKGQLRVRPVTYVVYDTCAKSKM